MRRPQLRCAVAGARGDHYWAHPETKDSKAHKDFVAKFRAKTGAYPIYPTYHMAQALVGLKTGYEAAIKANTERFNALTERVSKYLPDEGQRYVRQTWERLPEVIGKSYRLGMARALRENGFQEVPADLVADLAQAITKAAEEKSAGGGGSEGDADPARGSGLPAQLFRRLHVGQPLSERGGLGGVLRVLHIELCLVDQVG